MNKLEDAVNRARTERSGVIGTVSRFTNSELGERSVEAAARIFVPSPQRATTTPSSVRYTKTRTLALNEQTLEANRVIAGQQGDERVEAYRQLRTQLLQKMEENEWRSLAVTSPMKNAGKTLTAVNLAISLAQEINHTVLLVDLDLSEPDVHTTLGVDVEYGVVDVVEGRAKIEDTLFSPNIPRLSVLPGVPLVHYSSELLSSPGMRNLLQDMTSRYESRIVIFDLPPLLRNDDALKFTPFVDATLLVVEAGENNPEEIERSLHLMSNANLIGTILNKAR